MRINIALCSSESFSIPCLVTIASALEHNKEHDIQVFVLTTGFSKKTEEKFNKLAKLYGRSIKIINLTADALKGVEVNPIFSIMTYFRFFLPDVLSGENKVLYLDCDMFVRGDIGGVWTIDLSGNACAVVEDQFCDDVTNYNRLFLKGCRYFNAGMLLMNLEYWREYNLGRKCIQLLVENVGKFKYYDQDALNIVIEDSVRYVSQTYNYQIDWDEHSVERKYHYRKWPELDKVKNNPIIFHFCGPDKPWYHKCKSFRAPEYRDFAYSFDFIGFKTFRRYNLMVGGLGHVIDVLKTIQERLK